MITVGLFLTLNNSIYQPGGINDVCNHVLIKNNPKYINSVMYQLEMVTNINNGKRYGAKTTYEPYYEDKLNHITFAVVQFKFLQAIDKDDFETAKQMADLLRRNYHNIFIPQLRLSMIFEILYTDLVIDKNMTSFRRHFKWITEKEKLLCSKYETDLTYYYNLYNKIYNKDYDIIEEYITICDSEAFMEGESLSIEKKYKYLLETIDFYVSNGNSFVVKEE